MSSQQADPEMEGCTFKPNVRRSGKSLSVSKNSACTSPRGADECAKRLRKAFAEKDWRRRYLEERCPNFSPGSTTSRVEAPSFETSPVAHGSTGTAQLVESPRDSPLLAQSTFLLATLAPQVPSAAGAASPGTPILRRPSQETKAPGAGFTLLADSPAETLSPEAPASASTQSGRGPQPGTPGVRRSRERLPKSQPSQRRVPRRVSETHSTPRTPKSPPSTPQATIPQPSPKGSWEEPRRPVVLVEVSITKDQPPQKVALYAGDDISKVAQDFAAKHRLQPHMADRVQRYFADLMCQSRHLGAKVK